MGRGTQLLVLAAALSWLLSCQTPGGAAGASMGGFTNTTTTPHMHCPGTLGSPHGARLGPSKGWASAAPPRTSATGLRFPAPPSLLLLLVLFRIPHLRGLVPAPSHQTAPEGQTLFSLERLGMVALDGREIGLLAPVGLRWPVSAVACRAVPYCANTQDRPAGGEPGMLGPCHGWWRGRAWPPRGPGTVPGRLWFAVRKRPSPPRGSSPVPAWPCCAPDVVLFRHGDGPICVHGGGVPRSPPAAQPHGCLQQQLRCPHVPTSPRFQVPVCQHPQVPKSRCPQILLSPDPVVPTFPPQHPRVPTLTLVLLGVMQAGLVPGVASRSGGN